ncbi:hypothetical protein [uncultured Psychroserpens sp.]|uniref:tetratricopeptide repeat protein n=1 Tax=uncultured Psychroserpens sp. TaxID=255436 RepID=UPI00261DE21F|nr:hypothetical protein [uncultured Psychroserpens sp.]
METNSNNISQEQLEAIERYINNTMAAEEQYAFEARLSSDADFKIQFEDAKTLLLGIETQSLKEQLDKFHDDIPTRKTPYTKSPKIRYLQLRRFVAAAMIIIVAGSFWFFNQDTNEKLYTKYFVPDPGLPTTMSSSTNFEFYDAMVNYKQGDYTKAIQKWNALPAKNDTINYFIGVAHLANNNEHLAISYLEKVSSEPESYFKNDANYYLGLANLKEGDIEKAKLNFALSDNENSKALLSVLNK